MATINYVMPCLLTLPSDLIRCILKYLKFKNKLALYSTCTHFRKLLHRRVQRRRITNCIVDDELDAYHASERDDVWTFKIIEASGINRNIYDELSLALLHKSINCINYLMPKLHHPDKLLLARFARWTNYQIDSNNFIDNFDFGFNYLKQYGYFTGPLNIFKPWDSENSFHVACICHLVLNYYPTKTDKFIRAFAGEKFNNPEIVYHESDNKIVLKQLLSAVDLEPYLDIFTPKLRYLYDTMVAPEDISIVVTPMPDENGHSTPRDSICDTFMFLINNPRYPELKRQLEGIKLDYLILGEVIKLFPENREQIFSDCRYSHRYTTIDYYLAMVIINNTHDLSPIINIYADSKEKREPCCDTTEKILTIVKEKFPNLLPVILNYIYRNVHFNSLKVYYRVMGSESPTVEQVKLILPLTEGDNCWELFLFLHYLAKQKFDTLLNTLMICEAPYLLLYWVILHGTPISPELESRATEFLAKIERSQSKQFLAYLNKADGKTVNYDGPVEQYLWLRNVLPLCKR